MKLIPCPLNGPRNAQEFVWGGEVMAAPPEDAGADAWATYLYLRDNQPGVVAEWVCHVPSNYWFILERDRATDRCIASHAPGDYFADTHAGGHHER